MHAEGRMKMAYFNKCEYCGASLDPGERCDCRMARAEALTNGLQPARPPRWCRHRSEDHEAVRQVREQGTTKLR